jgi:shikimate dehydrogenase
MADPFDFEKPDRYAVMGNPVAHSKSPAIHALFAQQFKHRIEYIAIQVDVGGFPQAVDQFRANGGKGLNVTVPFKLEAHRLAEDNLSERAKLAGAVNTLKFEADGRIFGDNTDGAGLMHDISRNLNVSLKGRQVLVLGAGGAVRGVIGPLLKNNPAALMVANRTLAKAREIVEVFEGQGKIEAVGFDQLRGKRFDVIINGTSASLNDEMPPLPETIYARDALAYDMMYGDHPTTFMDWSAVNGAGRVSDGLGMLVEQAAESYFVWRGVRPETRSVISAIRNR